MSASPQEPNTPRENPPPTSPPGAPGQMKSPRATPSLTRLVVLGLRRNPLYLLSAVSMAAGAKLYLFAPQAAAGELGLILLTLGILQAYELAVCGVTLALHRAGRSPEDQPSLLLVAVIFWTGPLAATLEMAQQDPRLGELLAAGVAIFAATELLGLRRGIELRLSPYATAFALLAVVLIAAGPAFVRISESRLTDHELALFASWWALGLAALLGVGALRWHQARGADFGGSPARDLHRESAFLGLVVAATATHLYAFNYAFFGHARLFYATPLLAAISLLAVEWLAAIGRARPLALAVPFAGLLLALAASTERFDSHVPVDRLPFLLWDPLATALAAATLVAWFSCVRLRSLEALHLGSAAACMLCLRLVWPAHTAGIAPGEMLVLTAALSWRPLAAYCGLAIAAYLLVVFLIRRRRAELAAALLVNAAALTVLLGDRIAADRLFIPIVWGWTWLALVHVVIPRPGFWSRMLPGALLVGTSCVFEFDAALAWQARASGVLVVAVFVLLGRCWPGSGYRLLALCNGVPWAALLLTRGVGFGPHARASQAVFLAFALLTAGALVSWYKAQLIRRTE